MSPFEGLVATGQGGTALLVVGVGPCVQDLIVRIATANHIRQVRLDALMGLVAVPLGRDLTVQTTQRLVTTHQHGLGLLLRWGRFVACEAVIILFRFTTSFPETKAKVGWSVPINIHFKSNSYSGVTMKYPLDV